MPSSTIWPQGAAHIEGAFCPIEEAKISVLDWGLTRSDCTYDVAHVWKGQFFRLDDHIARFREGMRRLRLAVEMSDDELRAVLNECVARTGLQDAYVSMTCTRGRPDPGSRDLRTCRNAFYCFAIPFVWIVPPGQQELGGASLMISDVPRIAPESVDPTVKNYHWLDMTMALWSATEHDAQLVLLRDQQGGIAEGPGYNVFVHVNGGWITPSDGILKGITRQTVIELCRNAGATLGEGALTSADVLGADEVFVSSTAGGIMPVTIVNGNSVGDGSPGPVTTALRNRYWEMHADSRWSTPVDYSQPPAN
jgi:branched-chain amino acid aminotransferase